MILGLWDKHSEIQVVATAAMRRTMRQQSLVREAGGMQQQSVVKEEGARSARAW
jgi:hypothetical protein